MRTNEGPVRTLTIGGERHEYSAANQVIVITAEWLVRQGKLTAESCPVAVTPHHPRQRYVVNTTPVHSSGKPFVIARQLSNDLWVEANSSKQEILQYPHRLLKRFECPCDTLVLPEEDTVPDALNQKPPTVRTFHLDGEAHEYTNEIEVLKVTAEWLVHRGELTAEKCPVSVSRFQKGHRYLVHTRPVHSEGQPFGTEHRLSNELILEANQDSGAVIKFTRLLLEQFGHSGTLLVVE